MKLHASQLIMPVSESEPCEALWLTCFPVSADAHVSLCTCTLGTKAELCMCASATPNAPTRCCAAQKFAAHYTSCVFLKFFGNANENTKYLFRDRLQTPLTPTFSFWRRGVLLTAFGLTPCLPVACQAWSVAA